MKTETADLVLTTPDMPPTWNKFMRMHWAKRRELGGIWNWVIYEALNRAGIKGYPQTQYKKVYVVFSYKDNIRRDKDNANMKIILDALKNRGLIKDDSVKDIEVNWDVKLKQEKKELKIYLWEGGENAD